MCVARAFPWVSYSRLHVRHAERMGHGIAALRGLLSTVRAVTVIRNSWWWVLAGWQGHGLHGLRCRILGRM